jgi:hypothetical protein
MKKLSLILLTTALTFSLFSQTTPLNFDIIVVNKKTSIEVKDLTKNSEDFKYYFTLKNDSTNTIKYLPISSTKGLDYSDYEKSAGLLLIRAGKEKNTAIITALAASVFSGLILSTAVKDSSGATENLGYFVGTVGLVVSVGFSISGNRMMKKAGERLVRK